MPPEGEYYGKLRATDLSDHPRGVWCRVDFHRSNKLLCQKGYRVLFEYIAVLVKLHFKSLVAGRWMKGQFWQLGYNIIFPA